MVEKASKARAKSRCFWASKYRAEQYWTYPLFLSVMVKASPQELNACVSDMNRWFAEGRLKPQIGCILPLSQTAEAHRRQEQNTLQKAGTLAGKIVLKPD